MYRGMDQAAAPKVANFSGRTLDVSYAKMIIESYFADRNIAICFYDEKPLSVSPEWSFISSSSALYVNAPSSVIEAAKYLGDSLVMEVSEIKRQEREMNRELENLYQIYSYGFHG